MRSTLSSSGNSATRSSSRRPPNRPACQPHSSCFSRLIRRRLVDGHGRDRANGLLADGDLGRAADRVHIRSSSHEERWQAAPKPSTGAQFSPSWTTFSGFGLAQVPEPLVTTSPLPSPQPSPKSHSLSPSTAHAAPSASLGLGACGGGAATRLLFSQFSPISQRPHASPGPARFTHVPHALWSLGCVGRTSAIHFRPLLRCCGKAPPSRQGRRQSTAKPPGSARASRRRALFFCNRMGPGHAPTRTSDAAAPGGLPTPTRRRRRRRGAAVRGAAVRGSPTTAVRAAAPAREARQIRQGHPGSA